VQLPTDAPADPRTGWGLPPFGQMPTVATLDEVTTRVLAPNASPMTLDGTNTYVLHPAGAGVAAIVDPGPEDPAHLAAVQQVLRERDTWPSAVLVTHHHVDHAAAAAAWAEHFGARLHAPTPEVAGEHGHLLRDGAHVDLPGLAVEAVATPGHCADHLAFRLGTGALLSGDHVLGRGTSVVAHPDGDLGAYLTSLRRVLDLGPDVLFPGHGPELVEDPTAVVRYYLEHRAFRERQVLAVLADGPTTPRGIVEVVYADVDPGLWPAAEASTRAALDRLAEQGRIAFDGDRASLT
jgi:glyoxylase-like metal-dependent hydrolase (beta-lactamase superfamily II)